MCIWSSSATPVDDCFKTRGSSHIAMSVTAEQQQACNKACLQTSPKCVLSVCARHQQRYPLVSVHRACLTECVCLCLQDISNVSPWSQITAQFNLFNSGSGSTPATSTAGRKLLQGNSSFADFAPQDTTTSDITKEGESPHLI